MYKSLAVRSPHKYALATGEQLRFNFPALDQAGEFHQLPSDVVPGLGVFQNLGRDFMIVPEVQSGFGHYGDSLLETVRERLRLAEAAGWGDEDFSALIKLLPG